MAVAEIYSKSPAAS